MLFTWFATDPSAAAINHQDTHVHWPKRFTGNVKTTKTGMGESQKLSHSRVDRKTQQKNEGPERAKLLTNTLNYYYLSLALAPLLEPGKARCGP